eukprot:2433917-Amphidinium_carterae.1
MSKFAAVGKHPAIRRHLPRARPRDTCDEVGRLATMPDQICTNQTCLMVSHHEDACLRDKSVGRSGE